ncbi:MAG: efflux RND transporter periplasmic adaptor subunit [Phycisphaerales bacterium]|nr:efflux RND transporter periplasmic adaptor subunit [Phycisphaerales bacterium]
MDTPPPPVPPPLPSAQHRSNPVVSILVWVLVLGGLSVGAFFAWKYAQAAQQAGAGKGKRPDRATPVVVEAARVGDMNLYIEQVGNVAAYNTVTVRTRIDGELKRVAFAEGQTVKRGDVLFEIDPRPYAVQLVQAQSQLAQAQGQRAQAQGQLSQSQSQLVRNQATADNARRDLERYRRAAEAISEQQITTAEAAVATAEADVGTAKASIETAKASIETANASIETANAAIEAAKLNIAYCTITSPLDGRIGLRMVDEGNFVRAADANGLVVITQLQPIAVVFSPAQDDLSRLQKARLVNPSLPTEAMDRVFKHLSHGKLESVDNQIDPTTATFKVKAVFANEDNVLFPNLFVNVRLLVETLKEAILVPDAAVQLSPKGHFCYVVKDGEGGSVVEMRMVKIGASQDRVTAIKEGLVAGERVVTQGVDKLQPGAKVVVNAPTTQPK